MRLAILSDIHGNQYALRAALAEARKEKVEHLLILGDVVGYYYRPDLILEMLEDWEYNLIRGNHEDILVQVKANPISLTSVTQKYGRGIEKAIPRLTKEQIEQLNRLPDQQQLTFDGLKMLLCHGAPWDHNAYVYPDASSDMIEYYDDYSFDFIFSGHTHYPCAFKTKNGLAINPGSIGQSRLRGGYANWVLLDTTNTSLQFRATPYPIDELLREVATIDSVEAYHYKVLKRNNS